MSKRKSAKVVVVLNRADADWLLTHLQGLNADGWKGRSQPIMEALRYAEPVEESAEGERA